MSEWNVCDGEQVILLNVNTGLFAGIPKKGWFPTKQRTDIMIPVVTDVNLIHPFTVSKTSQREGNVITTDSLFKLSTKFEGQQYFLHAPVEVADITLAPPLRLTLVGLNESSHSLPLEWSFVPASKEQLARNDTVLHYGMPIFILKRQYYLRLDTFKEWLSVHYAPVTTEEMDPWILMPVSGTHTCFNPKAQNCHFLDGINVSHTMMTCKYANDGTVQCFDDGGHVMFRTSSQCNNYCRVPTFTCSGYPEYKCEATVLPIDKSQTWQDYDTCISECISPQLRTLYPHAPTAYEAPSPSLTIDYRQWIWVITVLAVSLAVLVMFVYVTAKKKL
jgi:hypothetical protein